MLNLKGALLFSLVAFSVASPTFDLQTRANIPATLKCSTTDGKTSKEWTKDQIAKAKSQAKTLGTAGYAYPKKFGNKDAKGNDIFAAQGQLWEFPLTDPVWTNGNVPGAYRVIVKDNYDYAGVTAKDSGVGDTVHKC
ncbi:hypothetical protein BGZ60DRAFT_532211 [Tricladium varicosporioides]|nr:hypothetical protein BGZ60DRAFT_532211 [Hymenoscyphus varicosporioides]